MFTYYFPKIIFSKSDTRVSNLFIFSSNELAVWLSSEYVLNTHLITLTLFLGIS